MLKYYSLFLCCVCFFTSCSSVDLNALQENRIVSKDLFTEQNVNWHGNYKLNPDGSSSFCFGFYTTPWIQGEGVYKIIKPSRESTYIISYSNNGEEGTNVISFQNCMNSYFVVPADMPYFRITVDNSNVKIKRVKEFYGDIIDIREFGAKGDGVTDDTEAIQDAIDFVVYGLGGSLFIPNGTFLLNTIQEFDNTRANLIIPYNRNRIPFLNDYDPNKIYNVNSRVLYGDDMYICIYDNTTGIWDITKWVLFDKQSIKNRLNIIGNGRCIPYKSFIDLYSNPAPALHQGSFLLSKSTCDTNDGTQSPVSVISCGFDRNASFQMNSNVVINIKGITLKSDNRDGYSRLSGIDMSHCQCLYLEDVSVFSADRIKEVYTGNLGYLHESNHFSCGIMMPATFCDPTSYAHNVTVSGSYTIGFVVGDCQSLEDCWVGLCRYGYVQCEASHPSVVGGHIFCFNTNVAISSVASVLGNVNNKNQLLGVYSSKNGFLFINQISVEPSIGMPPTAFNMEYIVYDPSNSLHGAIAYINADSPAIALAVSGGCNLEITNLGM